MRVHGALGLAGRAGGVEPEADFIAHGRRGHGVGRRAGQQILEARMAMSVVAGHDDMGQVLAVADQVREFRIQLFGDDQEPGPAVLAA